MVRLRISLCVDSAFGRVYGVLCGSAVLLLAFGLGFFCYVLDIRRFSATMEIDRSRKGGGRGAGDNQSPPYK